MFDLDPTPAELAEMEAVEPAPLEEIPIALRERLLGPQHGSFVTVELLDGHKLQGRIHDYDKEENLVEVSFYYWYGEFSILHSLIRITLDSTGQAIIGAQERNAMKIKVTPKNPNLPTINASDAQLLRESLEAAADLAHEQGDGERLQALEGLLGELFQGEEPEGFDPTPYDRAEAVRRYGPFRTYRSGGYGGWPMPRKL
jgi:hypothetical protein